MEKEDIFTSAAKNAEMADVLATSAILKSKALQKAVKKFKSDNNIPEDDERSDIFVLGFVSGVKGYYSFYGEQFDLKMKEVMQRLGKALAEGIGEPSQEVIDWFNDDRNHCSALDMMPR